MITVDHVTFGYEEKKESLKDVSLEIHPGECVLLCGESGCGKTTLTKLINGLIPHFTDSGMLTGNVDVEGMCVKDVEVYQLSEKVGSVFQNPKSQFFYLDTDSELEFGLENRGAAPDVIRERIKTTVKDLKIEHLLHRNVYSLSGGEKQLLAFAGVYAMNPDIYVLDEPTANLDQQSIEKLRKMIAYLKQQKKTIVIAEHRLSFLTDLIDQAVYICKGEIVKTYSRKAFLEVSDEERGRMGLRSLRIPQRKLLPVEIGDATEGLCVENLCVGYKKEPDIIKNCSFTVKPGEILAVTGYNGVGKSTLIRSLCGLIKERSGTVAIDGKTYSPKKRQKRCSLVMQDVNHQLFSDSVWGECSQSGASEEKIRQVLSDFGLLEYKENHPMALSGGQKQRLAVAVAVLSARRVIIFDEPTSGLDYKHMKEVCKMVKGLAREGCILLIVSHDREFIQETCDRELCLS